MGTRTVSGRPSSPLTSDRHLRDGWPQRAADPETWSALDAVSDAELWAVREQRRAELVNFVKDRSVADRLSERQPREGIEAAYRAFDREVLTIGFARRIATYKRLHLLTEAPNQSLRLLADHCAIQVVLAGRAHPDHEEPSAACRPSSRGPLGPPALRPASRIQRGPSHEDHVRAATNSCFGARSGHVH
jgi:glycogen phosphorylase